MKKKLTSMMGILAALLVLLVPMNANAKFNIRPGAADEVFISLIERYEDTGNTDYLYIMLETADSGGFSADVEQQARAYVQEKLNPEVSAPEPIAEPTVEPEAEPTIELTPEPTVEPTATPTIAPTEKPTIKPTEMPTATPTVEPTLTVTPTAKPTATPTVEPEAEPTATPTVEPSETNQTTHLWIIITLTAVNLILGIIAFLRYKKMKRR